MKSNISLLLIFTLIIGLTPFQGSATSKNDKEGKRLIKLKSVLLKISKEKDSTIEIESKDGKRLKGSIQSINADHFVIQSEASGEAIPIPYPQVGKAKGNGLNKKTMIILGVAVAVFAITLTAWGISQTK